MKKPVLWGRRFATLGGLTLGWLCLALGFSLPAAAAVSFTCTVTASGINFGIYDPFSTTGNASTGNFMVTCTALGNGSATLAGTLSLSTGSSGTFATRQLLSGANKLNYNIYSTASHTQVMGDGTQGTYQLSASGTITSGQVYRLGGSMYGFMPASQDASPGSYADTVMVTVAY